MDPAGPQRAIVEVTPDDRVLQILAGAGSGKTEMLVWRVLYEPLVVGSSLADQPGGPLAPTFVPTASDIVT